MNEIKTIFTLDRNASQEDAIREAISSASVGNVKIIPDETDHKSEGDFLHLDLSSDKRDVKEAYDDGWAAYVCEDYEKAVYFFEQAANGGDADAAGQLGVIFDSDSTPGVPQDYPKAVFWFKKAALLGHTNAPYKLGEYYDSARGVKLDMEKAARLFEQAAENGFGYAQCRLGVMYELGRGVEKDLDKARFWYEKAAKPGNDAERRLKRMDGDEQAIKLWHWDWSLRGQGTSNYHDDIIYLCSDAFNAARNTEKDGDWARTFAAYKEAYQRYGSIAALYEIGRIYFEGIVEGIPDLGKAKEWWELGAKQGQWQSKKALESLNRLGGVR